MLHELWQDPEDPDGTTTFCLAGPHGDAARALLAPQARLTWTVEAASHFEAMTAYYAHRGWGTYTTDYPDQDHETYAAKGWEPRK